MAKMTNVQLRGLNIYQVFLRQHPTPTFKGLTSDLERIKSLGMDIIYLMPFYPIGDENKKGKMGSPYAIKAYKEVDPIYGSIEDFESFMSEAHKMGLKVMIDIVFNHSAFDHELRRTHPHWYFKKDGIISRKVDDWSDIIDFDYTKPEIYPYFIDVLTYYTKMGVDGFRCDVASLVPLDFWLQARQAVKQINPNAIFLGESVHLGFVKHLRDLGYKTSSDSELYEAFDMLYDYDIDDEMRHYFTHKTNLNDWLKAIIRQESIYPSNYIKLRCLENHDQPRIASYFEDTPKLLNLTALSFFIKGSQMIYMGQEYKASHQPSLFEVDGVDLTPKHMEIRNLIHRMSHLKKDSLFSSGIFKIHLKEKEVAVLSYENNTSITYGIFNVGLESGEIEIPLKDGVYQNILYPNQVKITNKTLTLTEKPLVIFSIKEHV